MLQVALSQRVSQHQSAVIQNGTRHKDRRATGTQQDQKDQAVVATQTTRRKIASQGWHTVTAAAKRLGTTPEAIRRRCHNNGWGRRVGGTFIISEYELTQREQGEPCEPAKIKRLRTVKLYTPRQAAEVLGLHERHTRALFSDGKLGRKYDSLWLVEHNELQRFKRKHDATAGQHATAKLTVEQVRAIRKNKKDSIAVLGKRYKVAPSTIHRIQKGSTWKG